MKRLHVLGWVVFLGLVLFAASALAVSGAGDLGDISLSASATVRYVAPTGSDTGNNCASSASPCRTVQRAVDQAVDGDEIRVATGTYTGLQTRNGLTQVVYVDKTVTVRGGYTTTNWGVSNPATNPTTLDAESLGRVMVVTGTITPTVEALRITGGDCTGRGGAYPWDDDAGGGIYIHTAAATVRHCDIYDNYSSHQGGGLYLNSSPSTLDSNHIHDNTARNHGGGLAMGNSAATLEGNTIENNEAENWHGGGLYMWECDATLTGNSVLNNVSQEDGAGAYMHWGEPVFTSNTFSGNTTHRGGGGLSLDHADATLTRNIIMDNTAQHGRGGGMYVKTSDAVLDSNIISGNSAGLSGGGITMYWSDATLTNNVIAGNQATGEGGGVEIQRCSPTLRHTTIANNTGASGVWLTDQAGTYASPTFVNTILSGHTVGVLADPGNTATFNGTLLYGNPVNWSGAGITHTNDHTGNPMFVNPGGGDYHIGHTSAAIDHGVDAGVSTDMDGDARPWGSGYDLGADEYTGGTVNTATATHTPTQTPTLTPTPTGTLTCRDDGYEDNDSCQDPAPVTPGTYPNLQICSGDEDWFSVDLNVGDTMTVDILFDDASGDLDLALYDPGCGVLDTSESSTDNEQVVWIIGADGTYRIQVWGFMGAENDYDLLVDVSQATPTPTPTWEPGAEHRVWLPVVMKK